jgi:hypothetical protein
VQRAERYGRTGQGGAEQSCLAEQGHRAQVEVQKKSRAEETGQGERHSSTRTQTLVKDMIRYIASYTKPS